MHGAGRTQTQVEMYRMYGIFFQISRWAQFEVYGVGAFLDRHNLQHMVLVQNRHAD